MTLKTRTGAVTKTHCNSCNKLLREDIQLTSILQKVMLKETVVNLGKGRHKCKACYKSELKSKWKFNLNPLKKGANINDSDPVYMPADPTTHDTKLEAI